MKPHRNGIWTYSKPMSNDLQKTHRSSRVFPAPLRLKGLAKLVWGPLCRQGQGWHHFAQDLGVLGPLQDLQRRNHRSSSLSKGEIPQISHPVFPGAFNRFSKSLRATEPPNSREAPDIGCGCKFWGTWLRKLEKTKMSHFCWLKDSWHFFG